MKELTQAQETAEGNWASIEGRLADSVDASSDCWGFSLRSRRSDDGVPIMFVGTRNPFFARGELSKVYISVVRLLWRLEKGEWPPCLMNACGDRGCVNPSHWKPFSPDRSLVGRKISMADAEKIRKSSETCRELARRYGINRNSVSRIKRGEIYR